MRKIIFVLIAAIALIIIVPWLLYTGDITTTQNQPTQPRMIMATMWVDNTSEPYLREMVREMAEAGANAIAVQVHLDKTILFQTDAFKDVPGMKVVNVLPAIIDEARKNNLSVYAWTDTLNFPELVDAYPDWEFVTCFKDGKYHYPTPCGWHNRISPFNPKIEDFIREYYHDLASLNIDGIQFQDDIFLAMGEDVSDSAQQVFYERYGWFNTNDQEDWDKMQILKTEKVTEIVKTAVDSARQAKPGIKFVFDVIPEADKNKMMNSWSIDVKAIADSGVDYIGIMSFHRQLMKENALTMDQSMDELNRAFASISSQVGNDRVIYRIWTTTFDNSHKPLSKEELDYVLSRMLQADAYNIGYIPHYPFIANYHLFENIA